MQFERGDHRLPQGDTAVVGRDEAVEKDVEAALPKPLDAEVQQQQVLVATAREGNGADAGAEACLVAGVGDEPCASPAAETISL